MKTLVGRLGGKFNAIKGAVTAAAAKAKTLVRESHLFAKTKEEKVAVGKKLLETVTAVHDKLKRVLSKGNTLWSAAGRKVTQLSAVMEKLRPQIGYFYKTGFVAKGKIIHLMMNSYSIVRGKAGKAVEFGLKWGINRIRGGFLQGFLIGDGKNASDTTFAIEALRVHERTFGHMPETYGYDRGGYSEANIKRAKKMGVKNVGIAPKGQAKWAIPDSLKQKVVNERAQVEGGIGTIKCSRYRFNKPNARSTQAMATYGHRAILGFNLRKLIREQAARRTAEAAKKKA